MTQNFSDFLENIDTSYSDAEETKMKDRLASFERFNAQSQLMNIEKTIDFHNKFIRFVNKYKQ